MLTGPVGDHTTLELILGALYGLLGLTLGISLLVNRRQSGFPHRIVLLSLLLAWISAAFQFSPFLGFPNLASQGDAFLKLSSALLLLLILITLARHVRKSPDQDDCSSPVKPRDHSNYALEGTSDGLWDWNLQEDSVWFSPRMKELLGFSDEEFSDHFETWERQLHPEDHQRTIDAIERHLKKNETYDITYRLQCKNQSYRWFRARGHATRAEDGTPIRMSGSIQDIHEQHENREKLTQNEELFRAVFERANIGIALTDKEGKFCEVNPALCQMLNYDEEALKARSFRSITHPEDLAQSDETHSQLEQKSSGFVEVEKRYIRKDGEVIYAITGVSRIGEGVPGTTAQTLVHIQDITRLKIAEKKAVESSEFKSQFLAHMSHEIRTPLGGLLGMLDLALGTQLTEEQEHFLVTAKRSSEQLMFLINDILDLSKIEAGRLEIAPQPFSLRESVNTMIQTLSLKAHEKGLELAYHIDDPIPDQLVADWSRIQQVLTNLLSNAIKFTPNGQVVLEIKSDGRTPPSQSDTPLPPIALSISVSDTGIGIPADKCKEVFEAFHHADSSIPQKYGGTGLGLAISQELVRLMGGKISLESEEGVGSRFSFTLLAQSQALPQVEDAAERQRDYPVVKALIVDDNETSLEFLSRTLLKHGVEPTGFTSTDAAESFLKGDTNRTGTYDLCILDSRIPGNEGLTFPARIGPYLSDTTHIILLLSSPNRELEIQRCQNAGFRHHLTKPVSTDDLLRLVDQVLHLVELPNSEVAPSSKKILLVEDNPINSEVALNFLKQLEHEVHCVENGREALEALASDPFDVVLMDLQMPEMSGLEATKRIREKELGTPNHQWIIALTAQAMKGDREECLAAGMDDYITKPIQRDALESALARAKVSSKPPNVSSTPANADPSPIIRAFDGEINVAKKVSQIFLETSPPLWDSLLKAIQSGDAKGLRSSAHRLKGSYMQFGADEAEQLAYQLEVAGRDNQLDGLEETVQQLQHRTRDLKKQIFQLLRH